MRVVVEDISTPNFRRKNRSSSELNLQQFNTGVPETVLREAWFEKGSSLLLVLSS